MRKGHLDRCNHLWLPGIQYLAALQTPRIDLIVILLVVSTRLFIYFNAEANTLVPALGMEDTFSLTGLANNGPDRADRSCGPDRALFWS